MKPTLSHLSTSGRSIKFNVKSLILAIFFLTFMVWNVSAMDLEVNPGESIQHAVDHIIQNSTDDNNSITIHIDQRDPVPYVENIEIIGFEHNLIIKSDFDENMPNYNIINNTIIMAPAIHDSPDEFRSVFYIYQNAGNETPTNITIQGLSITGGYGTFKPDPAGYNPDNDEPGNRDFYGGGICADGGFRNQNVTVNYCRVYNNYAAHGAGIYSFLNNLSVKNTEVFKNRLFYYLDVPSGWHTVNDGPKGAGIFVYGEDADLYRVKIFDNWSFIEPTDPPYRWHWGENVRTGGNYAALYFRNFCGGSNLLMKEVTINNNYTKVDPHLVPQCDWNVVSTMFVQRDENPVRQVWIGNCTIANNRIIITEEESFKAAIGLSRYAYEPVNTAENTRVYQSIVYNNTLGREPWGQSDVLHQQIIGFSDAHDEHVYVPVTVEYSDINFVFAENFYYPIECIDADPLFENEDGYNFGLRWNEREISPCIMSGYHEHVGFPFDRIDMGAWQFDDFEHLYSDHILPRGDLSRTVKWVSFPVINRLTEAEDQVINVFDGLLDTHIINSIDWKTIEDGNPTYKVQYINGAWTNTDHRLTSQQGYKINVSRFNTINRIVPSKGTILDPDTGIDFRARDGHGSALENWIGYYIPQTQLVTDALADVIDNMYSIKTETWSSDRRFPGPWTPPIDGRTISYGDMMILKGANDIHFHWNYHRNQVAENVPARPTHFKYDEQFDYVPINVSFSNVALPTEIGVFVNGVCKGAAVVEKNQAQILAYVLDDVANNSEMELVAYYGGNNQEITPEFEIMNPETGKYLRARLVYSTDKQSYMVNVTKTGSEIVPVSTLSISNYPNPFNPDTTIKYSLPTDSNVIIGIYNTKGQLVKSLVSANMKAGTQKAVWTGKDDSGKACTSGIYFCKLNYNGKTISKKMILTK